MSATRSPRHTGYICKNRCIRSLNVILADPGRGLRLWHPPEKRQGKNAPAHFPAQSDTQRPGRLTAASVLMLASGVQNRAPKLCFFAIFPIFRWKRQSWWSRAATGLRGHTSNLASERDLSWRIEGADGRNVVVKISNASEPAGVVDMQVKALQPYLRAGSGSSACPASSPPAQGAAYEWIEDGRRRTAYDPCAHFPFGGSHGAG